VQAIPESTIDTVLSDFEAGKWTVEEVIKEWETQQPILLGYFFSENFDMLTDEEKPYLLYLASVIWRSIHQIAPVQESLDQKALDDTEEANWELLNEANSPKFRDRLTPFFERTQQEDLLAFIEDSLELNDDDEDDWKLTKEGREPIFIGLSTMVDCLTT